MELKLKIQIMKTYRESFYNVLTHKLEWVQAMLAPFLLLLLGLIVLVFTILPARDTVRLTGELKLEGLFLLGAVVFLLTSLISMVSLSINGYRYAILQKTEDWFNLNLNMRFLKMALYFILYYLFFGLYSAASTRVVLGVDTLFDNIALTVLLSIILQLLAWYMMIRIVLYPIAISIDQTKPIGTSWRRMKGNILRFLGLIFLIGLTLVLIGVVGALTLILLMAPFVPANSVSGGIMFITWVIFILFMLWLSLSINFKAIGLVYQQLAVVREG